MMTTNDNAKLTPAHVNRERRAAFATLGQMLAPSYRGVLRVAGLSHPDKDEATETRALAILGHQHFRRAGTAWLAAQFAYRMIATRCAIERENDGVSPLDSFQAAALARLLEYSDVCLEGFKLQVPEREARVLKVVEEDLAGAILSALQEEAGARGEDFDEGEFWPAVFRGIGDADRLGHLGEGFGVVFLNHEGDWRARLRVAAGEHVLDLQTTH
jgi:hypothetical protein